MFSDRQLICEKYPELAQISQAAFAVLLKAIKAGQDSQVFIAGDSLQLARICWSITHGVSTLAISNQLGVANNSEILNLAKLATSTLSCGLLRQ